MVAEHNYGPMGECLEDTDEALTPRAYMVAIAVARPRARVKMKTFWYVFSVGGTLCSAWTTQTLRERVPEFLRPEAVPEE